MTGSNPRQRNWLLYFSIGLSVAAHLVLLPSFEKYGSYEFTAAVQPLQAVAVDLTLPAASKRKGAPLRTAQVGAPKRKPAAEKRGDSDVARTKAGSAPSRAKGEEPEPGPTPVSLGAASPAVDTASVAPPAKPTSPEVTSSMLQAVPPPLRNTGEFVTKKRERLTYRIGMMGLPVGDAVLEAKNERGEVSLVLAVKSIPPFSSIYPVDDHIESRHAAGNFIITKIRQQEGAFRSNRGFTLFLRDKKVFWMDLITSRSVSEPLPNADVLDILSALYYLRNRPLQIGRTESLHVYDSDTYSELPVEVLRREQVELPYAKKVDTLVIKPLLKTEGIFKRTGDITIWLTDDENKAPVKVETEIALGKITVELISTDIPGEVGGNPIQAVAASGTRLSD